MKRFLIIFAICFGSLVAFIGGYLGISYLAGAFDEEQVLPNDIKFEQQDYYVSDSFEMLITTDTENVNQKTITLSFNTISQQTSDKNKITDGVVIIPKTVKIGEPFTVELKKDLDAEINEVWVNGGVSTIIAKSQNKLIDSAVANVYVDVPVYKTELVVFNKTKDVEQSDSLLSTLSYMESNDVLVTTMTDGSVEVQKGDTFYMGLRYYPKRSAVKYSKINSTNLISAYLSEIENLLLELNVTNEEFIQLKNFFTYEANSTKNINISQFVELYSQTIASLKTNSQVSELITQIEEKFKTSLKYYTLDEKISNEIVKVSNIEKIEGTNFYKAQATETLGAISFYSYTFTKSTSEDSSKTLLDTNDKSLILPAMEQYSADETVIKKEGAINIVDVDVDTVEINGSINNIKTNQKMTIVVGNSGTNDNSTSYLQLVLKNSMNENIDLQDKIGNVGIRFEEKLTNNTGKSLDGIINFIGSETVVDSNGKTYYKPICSSNNSNSSYWEIYSETAISGDIKIIVKYFGDDGLEIESTTNSTFTITEVSKLEEESVSWIDNSNVDLKIINLEGIVNLESNGEEVTNYYQNVSYNFNNNIDIDENNFYQTYKVFLYTDAAEAEIQNDFYNVKAPNTYTLGINNLNLYELDGGILQIKNSDQIPTYELYAIFATIKTDYKGTPILTDGLYNIIKYSEDSDSNLSSIKITCSNSLKTITGVISINDDNKAGMVENEFKIAQNAPNVLKVTLTSTDSGFQKAVANGEISVVARNSITSLTNYVKADLESSTDTASYLISTKEVLIDTTVNLYISYTIFGQTFLYPLTFNPEIEITGNNVVIVKDTSSTAQFDFDVIGTVVTLDNLKQIKIDTIYEDSTLKKTYKYVTNDDIEVATTAENIFDGEILKVKVTNFLNRVGTDKWYLTSSNAKIISITEDGQGINTGIEGLAVVALYLEGVAEPQATVTFSVGDNGYVSKYITYDANGENTYQFNNDNIYNNLTIPVRLTGNELEEIKLRTDANNLFEMYYKIGETEYIIPFDIYVEEESSRKIIETLTGNTPFEESGKIQDAFKYLKINKNLGETLRVTFVYKNFNLGIYQNITLDITQTINIKSLKVTNSSDEEIVKTDNKYNVYSQAEYVIDAALNKTGTIYYYTYNDTDGYVAISENSKSGVVIKDGKFVFDDVGTNTEIAIYLSNSSTPTYGDLKYKMVFNVQPNIKTISNSANITLTEGKGTLEIDKLISRIINDGYSFRLNISTEKIEGISYANGILTFEFKNVTNSKIVTLPISFLGVKICDVTFTLYPEELETENSTRVAVYNDEKAVVLVVGDDINDSAGVVIDTLNAQFENYKSITIEGSFGEFYDESGKIINSTIKLLNDTGCYAVVKDNAGNATKYKLIISSLKYPFINFDISNEEAKELDIYDLFENTSNLMEYYAKNNLFTEMQGGTNELDNKKLLYSSTERESIFNTQTGTISFIRTSIDETEGIKYTEIVSNEDGYYLEAGVVGLPEVYVKVIMTCKVGTKTYQIPTIVKITQSQALNIQYPYVTEEVELGDISATDYDDGMLATTTDFGNITMEYLTSNVSNIANIELSSERFVVKKLEEGNWVDDTNYNSGYSISVDKVAINLNGSWLFVSEDKINQYVSVQGYNVTINKLGAKFVRVKLRVEANVGFAYNYYYLSVDEKISLTLYKKENNSTTIVNGTDVITVSTGDIITIKSTSDAEISYYLNNYNEKLMYSITGLDEDIFSVSENVLKANKFPNGTTVTIVLFTIYGKLAEITVNINPYYTFNAEISEVWGGTTKKLTSIIQISSKEGDVTAYTLESIEENGIATKQDFSTIAFEHVVTEQTININMNVNINNDIFNITLPLKVKPNILVNDEPLTNYSLWQQGKKITTEATIWDLLFSRIDGEGGGKVISFDNCLFSIVYNGTTYNCENDVATIEMSSMIFETTEIDLTYQIKTKDGLLLLAESTVETSVEPEYLCNIHYPQPNDETNFDREYVQVGTTISLLESGFDGTSRLVVKKYNLEESAYGDITSSVKFTVDGKEVTASAITSETEGVMEVVISVDDVILRSYIIEFISTNPYIFENRLPTIEINKQEQPYIFAGYGDEDVFTYSDIELTLPDLSTYITNGIFNKAEQFNIVLEITTSSEIKEVEVRSGLYYNSDDIAQKFRAVVKNSELVGTITKAKLVQGENEINITSYTISDRCQVSYNGVIVDKKYLNKFNSIMAEDDTVYKLVDIVVDKNGKDDNNLITLSLNANEIKNGVSLIDTFGIKDYLNTEFWYNHVGALGTITLSIDGNYSKQSCDDDSKLPYANSLVIEPQYNGSVIYDYSLKANGALYNGTYVKMTFAYQVKDSTFTKELFVKVISDIEYQVKNNDGTATQNSKENPLVLNSSALGSVITIVNQTVNNADMNNYYIYAYGKYSEEKYNVAQNMNFTVEGTYNGEGTSRVDYVTVTKSNGNIVLTYSNRPNFADREITITFTDSYGYSFSYYVLLVATYRAESVINNSQQVYEGNSIIVYNKNDKALSSNTKGIAITLTKDGETISDAININTNNTNIKIGEDSITATDIISVSGNSITFKFLDASKYWAKYGNGTSITFKVTLEIYHSSNTIETYSLVTYFTLNKKYTFSLATENTYVRDSEPFNLEQYVSVYDNELSTYLGEPTLTDVETLVLDGTLINLNNYVFESASEYSYTNSDGKSAILTLNATTLGTILSDITSSNTSYSWYSSLVYSDGCTEDEKTNLLQNVINVVLSEYGITYDFKNNTISASLVIEATNKITGAKLSNTQALIMTIINSVYGIFGNIKEGSTIIDSYITLGEDTSLFGKDVTKENYSFDIYLANSSIRIASTNTEVTIDNKGTAEVEDDVKNTNITSVILSRLVVNSVSESTIILQINGEIIEKELGAESNNILFTEYANATISLFTGKDSSATQYLNGFNLHNVKLAKGIDTIIVTTIGENGSLTETSGSISKTLVVDTFNYDANYQVYYQEQGMTFKVNYGSGEEEISGVLRITHKFTGINTSNAYVGTSTMHFVNTSFISENNNVNNVYFDVWANSFTLIPGIGKSAELAKNDDLSFVTNKDMLTFELTAVNGTADSTLIKLDNNNNLVIDDAILSVVANYYVTINVYCKGADTTIVEGTTMTVGEACKQIIGTIIIGFANSDSIYTDVKNISATTNTTFNAEIITLNNAGCANLKAYLDVNTSSKLTINGEEANYANGVITMATALEANQDYVLRLDGKLLGIVKFTLPEVSEGE